MTRILAELHPNGELRVSCRQLMTRAGAKEEKPLRAVYAKNGGAFGGAPLDNRYEFQEPFLGLCERLAYQGKKYRSGYGLIPRKTKFGMRGRRKILRVGGVMDQLEGVRAAITLTLPGGGMEPMRAMAAWSGFIANRVKTWLYDQVPNPKEIAWFFVWELQKRGALHMHLCLNCEDNETYNRVRRGIKPLWIRVLRSVQEKSGVSMFISEKGKDWSKKPKYIQVDCQRVKRSVSAYFAKYCSKQSKGALEHIESGLRPSRWWGCSRNISQEASRQRMDVQSYDISQEQADEIIESVVEACEGDFPTYLKVNPYNGKHYLISYPGVELGQEIMKELEYRFSKQKSCRLEAMQTNDPETQRRIQAIQRAWRDPDARYRLAELIGTDTYEWELLCYLMIDETCVPAQMVDQLLAVIDGEQQPFDQAKEDASEFYIPLQLDIAGL